MSETASRLEPSPEKGRRWAAFALVVLAPLCAELSFGSTPLHLALLVLPVVIPIYGAGVLLIREVVCRAGGGWPSLVVLGMAYELVEDGIGLQALTSTHLYDAASWGPRVLGLNLTYWEAQIGYHIVFSVLIPILLADLLFPRHRGRPYLERGGLIGVGVVAVLGVGLVRLLIPPVEDPGYQAPLPVLVGVVLAVAALSVLALRVLPRLPSRVSGRTAPRPLLVGVAGALASVGFLVLLLNPAKTFSLDHRWVPLLMTLAALVGVGMGWLAARWSRASDWGDRHRIWLAGGALVAHTLLGAGLMARTTLDRVGLLVIAALTGVLLTLLARSVRELDQPYLSTRP